MKKKTKIVILSFLVVLVFITIISIINEPNDDDQRYEEFREYFTEEEFAYLKTINLDESLILSYLEYNNFNVYNLKSYLRLTKDYDLKILESINYYNNPHYYSFYTNPSPALFPNTEIILVNKAHFLDKSYIPGDLIHIDNYNIPHNNWIYLRKIVLEQIELMMADLAREDLKLLVFSGYRSYDKQDELYIKSGRDDDYSARPGFSEHQTGYAFDISTQKEALSISFSETKEYKWLMDNAHLYGFILRYPEGKEKITGFAYEPWHFRYVGDHARIIRLENLTLEEYILSYFEI